MIKKICLITLIFILNCQNQKLENTNNYSETQKAYYYQQPKVGDTIYIHGKFRKIEDKYFRSDIPDSGRFYEINGIDTPYSLGRLKEVIQKEKKNKKR